MRIAKIKLFLFFAFRKSLYIEKLVIKIFKFLTNQSLEIDRLNTQILSLRKEIDTYLLRLNNSKSASYDLYIQLKRFLPKPLPDPIIFEESKFDQITKEIKDISESEKVQNFIIQAYETILEKINLKNQNSINHPNNDEKINLKTFKSKIRLKDDSDFLNYNSAFLSEINEENKILLPNNSKSNNYRYSILSRSAPTNKIQSLRRPMRFFEKINSNNIKKSLEMLNNSNNNNTKKKPTLFLAKSLNCNEANINHIFNITNNNYKLRMNEASPKKFKTETVTFADQDLSKIHQENDIQVMLLTSSTKALAKVYVEDQTNEQETINNEELNTNENEEKKNKKKFEVEKFSNSIENPAVSVQKLFQEREKEAFGKIPVTGNHLNNRKQVHLIEFCSNRLKNFISIEKIIVKFFGTLDPNKINSKLLQMMSHNDAMCEYEYEIHDSAVDLSLKREKMSTLAQQAQFDCTGMERLVEEGKKQLENRKSQLKEKVKETKVLSMQNQAIIKSINKIATIFKIDETEENESKKMEKILKKVSEIFQSNREILLGFRYTQMTTKLTRKTNFQIFDSASSMRKVTFSQTGNMPVPPINVLSSSPQLDRPLVAAAVNKAINSTSAFDGSSKVPGISLNSTNSVQEYIPGTRNSRRAFSAANSHRNDQSEQNNVDQELMLIGTMMGQLLVERFVPEFIQYKEKICLQEREEIFYETDQKIAEKLKTLNQTEFLKSLSGLYRRYRSYLHLLVYEADEIKQIDRSFINFLSKRNQYIEFLIDKKMLDNHLFVKEVSTYLLQDELACLWFIRDLVIMTNAKIMIPQLLQKIAPIFQRLLGNISPTIEREQAAVFIPWVSCFTAFLKHNKMQSTIETIFSLCNENLSKLVPIFSKSQSTSKFRAGLLSFFRFGCFLPHIFYVHIQFQNKVTSILHNFLRSSINFPSCVKAATDFFAASWSLLEEEVVMWHTAVFYHRIITEIVRQPLRDFNLNCFIEAMTLIVANRQRFTTDQLVKLNFLSFLIGNFQLEETVDQNKVINNDDNNKDNELKNRFRKKKSMFQSLKNINVSYLDLPMFKMTDQDDDEQSNPLHPSNNMENPKLQLHFQPSVDEKVLKLASKKSKISMNEYLVTRRKYPIYSTLEVHCHFIQMIFATLIDHSLHRLDVFFCDPFPQVNRKPNVLYTLMKHMEMNENAEIVQPLKEAFTPPSTTVSNTSKVGNSILSDVNTNDFSPISESSASEDDDQNQNNDDETEVEVNVEIQRNMSSILNEKNEFNNIQLSQFISVPNFIPDSKIDDIVLASSVRRSSRAEVAKDAFRREQSAQFQDYQRLLRMVVPCLFHPDVYKGGTYIASGAFGNVNAVTLNGQVYAVKVLKKSKNEFDNQHLNDVYTEVSILENCKGDRRVTQLFDYGTTNESYYIVMEFYPMTLKSWRKKYSKSKKKPNEMTLLRLFREFLNSSTVLVDKRINHFDIKCDNVMLDQIGHPALADFGEAMSYKNETNWMTLLNKGTEWIKSPEMLSIALNSSVTNPNFDRRRRIGAGPESDIWSIGCLFFELITGEFLFVDSDWSRFFLRITDPKEKLISDDSIALLGNNKNFQYFLEFVLQRQVNRRPNLRQVIEKFDKMFPDAMNGPLPKIEIPIFNS